jgi:signal transduction histidine kinase
MLNGAFLKRSREGRLRLLLSVFFLALAVPTIVLIWQAYGQLKWEAYYQHRGMAEELTRRIDDSLRERIVEAERLSFADYSFLVLAGNPSANFLQRSPLAAYPVEGGLPGVIGYFQVDAEGGFSSPILPPADTEPALVGIDADEYAKRRELADRLRSILSDNRLVRYQERERERDTRDASAEAEGPIPSPAETAEPEDTSYSQAIFDRLGKLKRDEAISAYGARSTRGDAAMPQPAGPGVESDSLGAVADLKLEPAYRRKVGELEESVARRAPAEQYEVRSKRKEQIALPETSSSRAESFSADADDLPLRISTFESEIDPLEFSLLDSGHFVLFRKVWREGQRYIQGILIDRDAFLRDAISERFEGAALAAVSDLILAYQDEVLQAASGERGRYAERANSLESTLLYRDRLSAPLDSLSLIFGVGELPPGPGARVLGWVTLLLAIVFLLGFYALYRLAMGQLRLARQQQDFVSAVSHELKTPLTSIRMYGEMLKEGWADETRRQQYYEYIHDESERLTRLISNVLQLASITRNEPNLAMRSTVVRDLMERIEERISSQVQRAGFDAVFSCDERVADAAVMIDEDCFLQVIINLVDNAIKFSAAADDRRVEIGSRLAVNGRVHVSVRDFGPGVPGDQMKKIFELFYRSESELTRETVGTGIGLAIVHQLCLAMGGSVDVVNRNPGAEFVIGFPIDRESRP